MLWISVNTKNAKNTATARTQHRKLSGTNSVIASQKPDTKSAIFVRFYNGQKGICIYHISCTKTELCRKVQISAKRISLKMKQCERGIKFMAKTNLYFHTELKPPTNHIMVSIVKSIIVPITNKSINN